MTLTQKLLNHCVKIDSVKTKSTFNGSQRVFALGSEHVGFNDVMARPDDAETVFTGN